MSFENPVPAVDSLSPLPEPRITFAQLAAPASEPVSVATFRAYAHLDDNDDTANLTALLLAARHVVEKQTGRVLVAQNWTATLERWPTADPFGRVRIRLNPPPLSITSVTVDGAAVASGAYMIAGDEIVIDSSLAAIPSGESLASQIVITFAASPDASKYPQLLVALQMLAAHWARNPEAAHTFGDGLSATPLGYGAIVATVRVMRELN